MELKQKRKVLIDTWWNVNQGTEFFNSLMDFVLIDTWWNVNPVRFQESYICRQSFNRYMVECESLLMA